MRSQIAAFIERALPRGFSAVLTLLLAKFTNPTLVGIYGYVTLTYTALQAATDSAVRQLLLRIVRERAGRRTESLAGEHFMRMYRLVVPPVNFVLIMGLVVALRLHGTIPTWTMAASLVPQALAPFATATGLKAVGVLQAAGKWAVMARAQLWASLASVVVVLPILVVSHNLFAPALQTLISESIVAAICIRAAARTPVELVNAAEGSASIPAEMLSMSSYSLLAWGQGQAERVLIGTVAGAEPLGIYGTASSVARAPGDALAASTANVVRAEIAPLDRHEDIQRVSNRVLTKALVLAAAGWGAAIVLALLLRPFMGPTWYPALDIVPILAITAFPSVLTWPASAILLRAGKGWHTLWAPVAGIVMAILIAWASTRSLVLASYLVIGRDLVTITFSFLFIPRAAPWRAFGICLAIVAVLGIGTWFFVA